MKTTVPKKCQRASCKAKPEWVVNVGGCPVFFCEKHNMAFSSKQPAKPGCPPIEELRKAVAERRKAKAPKVAPAKVAPAQAPTPMQVPVREWFA